MWAFGVTVVELFTYGAEPWAGCNGAQVSEMFNVSMLDIIMSTHVCVCVCCSSVLVVILALTLAISVRGGVH